MTAMAFDPTTYDDHTLIEAIKNLRDSRSDYLGSWGKKRLANVTLILRQRRCQHQRRRRLIS
ncbi:MAG: hypothetical protein RIR37_38 [Verrucomicrobiota bacterium]